MNFINFESANKKEKDRQELRAARDELLKRAEQTAKVRVERDAEYQLRGDSKWLLPAISKKLEKSEHKKRKKNKKEIKKHKSQKKLKKEKKREYSSTSDDSSSSSDSDDGKRSKKKKKNKHKKSKKKIDNDSSSSSDEDEWVEKTNETAEETESKDNKDFKRDDWMTEGGLLLKTFTREKKDNKKESEEKKRIDSYNPAKNVRELNPYWKNGGGGLPTFQKPDNDEMHTSKQYGTKDSRQFGTGGWRKNNTMKDEKMTAKIENKNKKVESFKRSEYSDNSNETESDSDKSEDKEEASPEFLTDQQMNELGAKIIKAEIMGNDELAKSLKVKLEEAKNVRNNIKERCKNDLRNSTKAVKGTKKEEHILLTTTDNKGFSRPLLNQSENDRQKDKHRKPKKVETHIAGERVRYFPDDDRYDIKQMFEREKHIDGVDSDLQFAEIAGKSKNPNDDLDDIFADQFRKVPKANEAEKEFKRAVDQHEKMTKILDDCDKCFESSHMKQQLMISMGSFVYLSLPWYEGLQSGHCLIVPMQHVSCSTKLDENVWNEITEYRKALTRMYEEKKQDVIFFEIARYLNRNPHMVIHCIPGNNLEMAPFYFKKAILESEHDWCTNKQLISLKDKDLRRSIPKGLPYFWVHFGMNSGFGHVIEDQTKFPQNFAQEIIGGMLNLNPRTWRKPRKEENSIQKVKQFADRWKSYDFTS